MSALGSSPSASSAASSAVPAPLPSSRPVLIVDPSSEARDVLRTLLLRRGVATIEATASDAGLEQWRRHQPQLVVLDVDSAGEALLDVCSDYRDQAGRTATCCLLLSSRPLPPGDDAVPPVAKPYHYGPLLRTIEELLQRARAAETS